ncbi:MAG: sigma-70 family RNA polymerase sigma factor [Chloroflexota bacterium]
MHLLIYRIARGDKFAQAELDSLVRSPLAQFVARRFNSISEEDVIEIVGQTILLMYLHAANYRGKNGDSSAWEWAYQIARNQAIKWLRITRREIHLPDAGDDYLETDESQLHSIIVRFDPNLLPDTVEDQVMERQLRGKAEEIIRQLSQRERLILWLHFEKDWTFKQIAARLNVKPARITQIMQGIQRKCQSAAGW